MADNHFTQRLTNTMTVRFLTTVRCLLSAVRCPVAHHRGFGCHCRFSCLPFQLSAVTPHLRNYKQHLRRLRLLLGRGVTTAEKRRLRWGIFTGMEGGYRRMQYLQNGGKSVNWLTNAELYLQMLEFHAKIPICCALRELSFKQTEWKIQLYRKQSMWRQ